MKGSIQFPVLLTLFVTLCLTSFAQGAKSSDDLKANWFYNIEEVKKIAEAEDKLILISFSGSDWCVPCMRLEKDLFQTESFIAFAKENLILLKLDFPARKQNKLTPEQLKHNEALAEIYNKKGAFPSTIIVNSKGEIKGYMEHPKSSSEEYINSIKNILNQ